MMFILRNNAIMLQNLWYEEFPDHASLSYRSEAGLIMVLDNMCRAILRGSRLFVSNHLFDLIRMVWHLQLIGLDVLVQCAKPALRSSAHVALFVSEFSAT